MKRLLACAAVLVPVFVLGLAACSPKTETPADGAAPAADAGASGPAAAPAAAPDVPAEFADGPAAGKWKITMSMAGQTLPATETCYATKTSLADAQKQQQQAGVTCGEQIFRKEGGATIGHFVCTMDVAGKVTKTTTDMRVTGDFNTKYTIDMTNKMEPEPAPGMGEQKITMVAERIGDC